MPGKIIEFERRPDFYFRRAQERFEANECSEALVSALKAVNAEPQKGEYLLLLAGIYSKLGLIRQSSCALTKALMYVAEMNRALYIIGMNVFADGRPARAKAVLSGSNMKEADRLRSDICLAEELNMPYHRAPRRALYWGTEGCAYLERGDAALAVRCFQKYTHLRGDDITGKLLLANALAMAGDTESAFSVVKGTGVRGGKPGILYAQLLLRADRHEEAADVLRTITPGEGDRSEELNYIYTLAALNMDERIHTFAGERLKTGRIDFGLAHALSASALRLGRQAAEVTEGWERILASDPGNPEAEFFISEYESGALMPSDVNYALDENPAVRLDMFEKAAACDLPYLARLMSYGDESALYALSLLAARGDEASARLIQLASVRPDFSASVRSEAAKLASASGCAFPAEFRFLRRVCRETCEEILPKTDARSAKIIVDASYNGADADISARLWTKFLKNGGKNVSSNADAACAALICAARRKAGIKPDYRALLKEYDLRPRQLKRVLKPMYGSAGITEDTDNAF